MTLLLRPFGRGSWHTIEIRFHGRRAPSDPLLRYRIGDTYALGGTAYRIVGVFS